MWICFGIHERQQQKCGGPNIQFKILVKNDFQDGIISLQDIQIILKNK
jgi:hypothetical protein